VGIEISASSIRRVIAPKRRPGPKRDTWSKFMRTQAASIVACDLFTVETVRMKTLHVLFFIDLHSRRVLLGGVTDGATNVRWCTQIARNLSEAREPDRRHCVSSSTTETIDSASRSMKYSRPRASRSFVPHGELQGRTLMPSAYPDRSHRVSRSDLCPQRTPLESVLKTYLNHYNRERPHRGLASEHPRADHQSSWKEPPGRSCAADRLGGLIHEYPPEGCISRLHEHGTSVLHTAQSEFRGLSKRAPAYLDDRNMAIPLFRAITRGHFFARSVTIIDDTLQVFCGALDAGSCTTWHHGD